MADSIPICDVLSEAMEYLTKLGTNIRIRSENLRDKRIRKDRLRNTHAIHKVVDKVLLICELSKKSIENVETGVKSLLLQMEKAGATFGPGPKTRETSDKDLKYEYFTYESRKLKIRNKISLEHYTSVRVLSTSMALSTIEKYPVYHDCKLYRLRRRKKTELSVNISKSGISAIQNSDEIEESCVEEADNIPEKVPVDIEHKKVVTQIENPGIEIDNEKLPNNDGNQSHQNMSKNEITQSISTTENENDCDVKPKKKKYSEKVNRFRHTETIDSTTSSGNNKVAENITPCDVNVEDNSGNEMSCVETAENGDGTNVLQSSNSIKPVIKCVSLSKLLKPNRIQEPDVKKTEVSKHGNENDKLSQNKKTSDSELTEETMDKNRMLQKSETSKSEDEDAYWLRKRKQVKKFKSKDFNINVSRLPKITNSILEKYNLKRITQMGSVICEKLNHTNEKKSDDKGNKDSCEQNDCLENVDINTVKNALLDDSDTDNDATCQINKNPLDETVTNGSGSEIAKNANEELETELYKEKQNKKACESYETTSKKSNCPIVNVQEDQTTDNINVQTKEIAESNECVTSKEKQCMDTEKDSNCKNNETVMSTDVKKNSKTRTYSKPVNNQNIDKHGNRKFNTEKKKKKVLGVKQAEKLLSDNSDHESEMSQFGAIEVQDVNDKNELTNSQNAVEYSSIQDSNEKDIDKVKNTLLIDSDSELQDDKEQENSNTLKKCLLEDSDSGPKVEEKVKETSHQKQTLHGEPSCDNEPCNETEQVVPNTIKNFLLAGSDSESQNFEKNELDKCSDNLNKIEQENKSLSSKLVSDMDKCENIEIDSNKKDSDTEVTDSQDNVSNNKQKKRHHSSSKDAESVKSSLLKDSSDDVSNTPKKQRCYNRDSPPQSKRKHIMESMYAKKMLLTYSSSSDTEDEQLRNVLKEIKEELLKGISSDEDESNRDTKDSLEKLKKMPSEIDNKSTKDLSEEEDDNETACMSKSDSSESHSEKEIKKEKSITNYHYDSDSRDTNSNMPIRGNVTDKSSKHKMGHSSATPDGSCSQNSDIQDTHDKEIAGLTNLKSLEKTRRRRKLTRTRNSRNARSRRGNSMAKASGLISNEGFLEAESSSDVVSLSGSDHADNNDLDVPRVKLSDINGGGIGHLAKDDLLVESDTSVSHDEKKNFKKEDDTDEDNIKSKRRKAVAISSDSEAGSSRRKENNFRLSDFEDSEDESSEPVKNKRKKKIVDSDASAGSSDDAKKKRRRIKTLDESDVSGSDTENEGRNKHGRKNIRKVMSKNQLEEATKKAAREEKERIARISERQKLYNNLEFDESGKPDEVVLEKVVLDFDPETKEPLIQVDRGLVKKLKPHQANGIKFMWDACFESVKRIKKDKGSGCILAHCMGLGKTLQVVSLTHTLLTHGSLTGVNRVLVVCPLSTVLNWVNEFRMWLKHAEADYEVDVYELSKFKQNSERAFQLSQWYEQGGVCVLGYEMFRNLSADKGKKFKKKILKNFQESLVDPGPDLVVCDEGHLLKNEKTSLSQSMNRVKTRRRIVLTGTPLQNNLKEYYCMVQFVKPNLLGKYNEYLNRFVNPITNGQYTDSTEHDIRVMKRRSHVLHKMLDGAVQRRDYGVLAPFLPPKHEYVLFITLTDVQIKLYHHYLDNYSRRPQAGKSSGFLFPDFQSLQRIWTHPLVLKYNSERYEIMQQKKREREEEDSEGSLADFIDDDSTPDESSTEESSDDLSDLSDDSRKKSKKKKSSKKGKGKDSKASSRRGTRANPIELDDDEPIESLEVKSENPTEWWMKLVSEEELEDLRNSHKLILLFDILRQCEAIGDKLLVFSQSLYSLDLIEHFLGKVDEATQAGRVDEKLGGHVGSWSPGVDYFRLDGSTSCENRSIWCKNFNRVDNQRARLFLISTRAGGLGINLVAANRVVIFDVSWNPSHDVQSIFRVYRFGQKKPCYVYRFLAMGTMEEKIYERQVTKQAISKRVIDEQQIDRHYAENDLAELYKFEPQPPVPRPLPPLPKDRLFAEMLKEHEAQIYKYHEHDSLLENKEEETLSEEERRAAWEDFENEKTRPPPQPFLSPYAMHNGMVQGLLAQQQQMAMATISAMLRKDMPNMSDQQLRETVPLILASNPGMFGGYDYGLMQKMSEIYKYAQPGMMNPGMMNPMNAGSGMSGGSGMGASALHYEPPWLRQQEQQQQLRLQQLMQHQNTLGAKYYAGGLGSRDPMAMALQQQRARELMHRPRARGRPPLASVAPRPPPAHAGPNNSGDVVNLDSD